MEGQNEIHLVRESVKRATGPDARSTKCCIACLECPPNVSRPTVQSTTCPGTNELNLGGQF